MGNERRELADIAVNEMGQLVEIPGIGKAHEYGTFGSPMDFLEKPVNKMSDCYCWQGWCEENYYQEEDENADPDYTRLDLSGVCFGFNPQYVDPYRGW